jgi:hypothetical protein
MSAIRILRKLSRRNRLTLKSRIQPRIVLNEAKSFSSDRHRMSEKSKNGYKMVTLNEKGAKPYRLTPCF